MMCVKTQLADRAAPPNPTRVVATITVALLSD